jgi:signal transduction histidine kinase
VTLVVAASIPILAVSGFFGYILARGFTKRLESVSQVTSAIGAGDLSRRAPVDSRNEIGRLAQDVNSMAGHLETTMTELTLARTEAESALRARQELVAAISHELRTPLAVLQAQLEAVDLAEHAAMGARDTSGSLTDSPLRADTLEVLRGQTAQLTALVNDLFALAQADTRTLTVRHDPVDVSHVVEGVVNSMRPLARRERAITLVAETVPGLPMASGDTERLEQILSNLIRNAVRHTPDGGIIAVSTVMESDHILISVADTGEGIADDHLPHIFEPFYRADSARSRETGGAGLGLAIVRELVELMGGSITVESKRGEGSRFKVILPPNPA